MARQKWLVDGPRIIDVHEVRALKVGLVAGRVDIVGHDEPGARVEVHSVDGKPIKVSIEGDVLEVDHPQLNWENFIDVFKYFRGHARAEVSILVPRNVELKLGVVSASAIVSGLRNGGKISTVSGEAVIDNTAGVLDLNAVSGELSVRDHQGTVNARTVGGDVAATGDIVKFSGDTVSGNIMLDLAGIPDTARVSTVSGDVTVRLAPGVPAEYKINTVSGKVQLDDSEITGVVGGYSGKYGQLDDSWLEFRATTVSGDVSVMHAVDERVK
ncbi:DUF4097 family beta strand repeat-containing protein [Homoserinimonas sp. A520]